jgi:hypothetical protein
MVTAAILNSSPSGFPYESQLALLASKDYWWATSLGNSHAGTGTIDAFV